MGVGPEARGLEVAAADGADRAAVRAFLSTRREAAFLELYDRHTPALYQFALRLLAGSERDAEDAVQEAWLRAVDGLAGFGWRSSLRTWLCGFVLNCAREVLRRSRPGQGIRAGVRDPERAATGAAGLAAGGAAGGAAAAGRDAGDRIAAALDLERALARLPDDMRVALVLHDVHGYTHEEVATMLAIGTGTSKSRTSRARARMRELLDPGPRGDAGPAPREDARAAPSGAQRGESEEP